VENGVYGVIFINRFRPSTGVDFDERFFVARYSLVNDLKNICIDDIRNRIAISFYALTNCSLLIREWPTVLFLSTLLIPVKICIQINKLKKKKTKPKVNVVTKHVERRKKPFER